LAPPGPALARIRDLSVWYTAHQPAAVAAASLDILPNETLAVVGESGSGKTTLANAIIGLLPAQTRITGQIWLGQNDLTDLTRRAWRSFRGRRIGYIPQDPMLSLNEVWSIGRHFRQTIAAHHLAPTGWRQLAVERLAEVELDDPHRLLRQFPHQLSGGMRQRVLIALALLARPDLIIADEPTSALDVLVQKRVLDLLGSLTRRLNASLMLITHDLGLVADRADRVAVMKQGQIVESGSTGDIIRHPGHSYTRQLLGAVPRLSAALRPRTARPIPQAAPGSQPEAGRSASQPDRPGSQPDTLRSIPQTADQPALNITDLVKDYRLRRSAKSPGGNTLRAVDHASFTVQRGECLALVGESGSGKSTIAKLILGLERPTAGHITVSGLTSQAGRRPTNRQRQERGQLIQVVFQDPYASLDPQFTVARVLAEPLIVGRTARSSRPERIAQLLNLVGLPSDMAQRYPSELSGGQRQRVAIARALAPEPDVLICDEAVSALDVLVQAQILDTLGDLRHKLGLSMLFITHDLAVVAEIADTVAVITNGRIVETGPVPQVFADPRHPYTRQLLAAVPGQAAF
jgi:peptide/nickel transport system ATP-binding protein